jgi:hypothetical protein
MVNEIPESSGLVPEKLDRPRALLRASGLLAFSAVLIVVEKRGILDAAAGHVAGLAGLTLGLCGFLYLLVIYRFQVSIGRFMTVVALIALLLQSFLVYWNWLEGR